MLSADVVREVINLYVPTKALRHHPFASPLNGNFNGLPPLLLTIIKDAVLYDDALQLRHKAEIESG
jgi:acetyl esterase/lipase